MDDLMQFHTVVLEVCLAKWQSVNGLWSGLAISYIAAREAVESDSAVLIDQFLWAELAKAEVL